MARKVQKKAAAAAEPSSAADDLSVLHPNATIVVAGRTITMREYGFLEGLEIAHRASGLIADMVVMCADDTLTYAAARRLFGVHRGVVAQISAIAADVEPQWVEALAPKDGEYFLSVWFVVNGSFFGREVAAEARETGRRAIKASTSRSSSPASPPPDSATSTGSDGSPSAS